MDASVLESLGITREVLEEKLLDRLVEQFTEKVEWDREEGDFTTRSPFSKKLVEKVRGQIDASIAALAEKHVLPNVHSYIENLTLTETNTWGEKKGKPVTFIEYLVERINAYILEDVDYQGNSQAQARSRGNSWTKATTRITHLVSAHLRYNIEQAVKLALATANSTIVIGLEEAVKIKLAEVAASLQVLVKHK